ncbi:MAG TPA: thioredoxin domain-containing protein, partial [archaeon]|nr:thioredoxin domain-containing protein [archaeon]
TQTSWVLLAFATTPVPPAQLFLEYAAELGLDKAAFSACTDARTFQKEVLADQTAGTKAGVSGTPTFFVNSQKLIGAMPFESYQKAIEAELASPTTLSVSVDDDPTLGSATASVTIVEFADFQGPYSARFANAVLPELKKQYIDTGKVSFVYRDFPLSFYAQDQAAAEAAACANAQGGFWAYHDRLFLRQAEWSGGITDVPAQNQSNSTTGSGSG